jgi:hypothetical protein
LPRGFAEIRLHTRRKEDYLSSETGDGVDGPRDALVFEVGIGFDIDGPIGRAFGDLTGEECPKIRWRDR